MFDLIVSLSLLVLLSPLIGLTALAVRIALGKGILFRQQRPGLHAQPFLLFKFRSMTDARGPDGKPLPDAQRLPAFGKFLRATSMDELPSLLNVIRGEMSLVGPRPLLMQYVPLYDPVQFRRHEVKPGITGWAQINGRNALSWDAKFAHDVWYVDNRSFALDLKILWRTAMKVIRRDGISAEGQATMSAFKGNGPQQ